MATDAPDAAGARGSRPAESVAVREVEGVKGRESRSGRCAGPGPSDGGADERGNQFTDAARAAGTKQQATPSRLDGDVVDAVMPGEMALPASPGGARDRADGAFDARAIRHLVQGGADRSRKGCGARSAAASYVRSSRWRTRRSTSWSAAGIPGGSISRRAAWCGTWPR